MEDIQASFTPPRYSVVILKEGFYSEVGSTLSGGGHIALIKGPINVLVGTGLPSDKDLILQGLEKQEITADQVDYVVCEYGSIEHTGNRNLFPNATHIVGYDIMRGDQYILHDFNERIPFEIDESIEIIPTPGHVQQAVSVKVSDSGLGTVVFSGSCFFSEEDEDIPELWIERSTSPDTQQESRIDILRVADYIFPRYGSLFRVPDKYRRSEAQVVMTP